MLFDFLELKGGVDGKVQGSARRHLPVSRAYDCSGKITLTSNFPKQTIAYVQARSTLQELGLVPQAILFVHTEQ